MYSSYLIVLSFCRSDRSIERNANFRSRSGGSCSLRIIALRIIMLDAELAETLVHLSLFAQLGVLIREYLCRFFVNGCDGTSWGPCRMCRNCSSGGGGGYRSTPGCFTSRRSRIPLTHARLLARLLGRCSTRRRLLHSVACEYAGAYRLPSSLVARRSSPPTLFTAHHAPRTRAAFVPFVRGRL